MTREESDLRLECLRLAVGYTPKEYGPRDVVKAAEAFMGFVTNAKSVRETIDAALDAANVS